MFYRTGENPSVKRKNHVQQLLTISRSGAFETIIEHEGEAGDKQKYEHVGYLLFKHLQEQPGGKNFNGSNITHGYNVCARIAGHGVNSYAKYVQATDREASVEELSDILSRSYEPALTTFTDQPADACQVMEYAFGLIYGSPPNEPIPFGIEPFQDDEARLVPSKFTAVETTFSVVERRLGTEAYERCAARGKVLKQVWAATIGTCAINEYLFPADVGAINAGTYELPA